MLFSTTVCICARDNVIVVSLDIVGIQENLETRESRDTSPKGVSVLCVCTIPKSTGILGNPGVLCALCVCTIPRYTGILGNPGTLCGVCAMCVHHPQVHRDTLCSVCVHHPEVHRDTTESRDTLPKGATALCMCTLPRSTGILC